MFNLRNDSGKSPFMQLYCRTNKNNESHLSGTGSPRADVGLATQLPCPVMSLYVNPLAVNHSKVASDKNWFPWLFLTFYRKALTIALNNNLDCHIFLLSHLRAMGGLNRSTHPHIDKKRSIICVDKYSAKLQSNWGRPLLQKNMIKIRSKYSDNCNSYNFQDENNVLNSL